MSDPRPTHRVTLGDQLRAELGIAKRQHEDADRLVKTLDMAAQLADQVDRLLAENSELTRRVFELTHGPTPEPFPGEEAQ